MNQVVYRNNKEKAKYYLFFKDREALASFLFLLVVIGGFSWVTITLFNWMNNSDKVVISRLIITGNREFTTDDDIRQAILSLGSDHTFIAQNVDDIQRELKRLTWIKQVSVRKEWPDTLRLHIIEYVPVAYWNDTLLLDEDANIFNITREYLQDKQYPRLYGPEGHEKDVLNMYNDFKAMLDNYVGFTINSLTTDERYAWWMIINNQFKLELGRKYLNERLQRFLDLYLDILSPLLPDESIITVDLRYESGMAIDRKG